MSFAVDGPDRLAGGFPAELFRVSGDPVAVRGSAQGWLEFRLQACEAADDIRSLDTSLFVGPEADQYREGLDADLVPHLERTGQAYSKVGSALAQFAADLGGLQEAMAPLTVRAPNVWELLQVSHANLLAAQSADTAHRQSVDAAKADLPPGEVLPPDGYVSDTSYATSALSSVQQQWDDCLAQATAIKARLAAAIEACTAAIKDAEEMRFARNSSGFGSVVSGFKSFVKDHAGALAKISSALKLVSGVCAVLSFIPVIDIVAAPLALATGAMALGIDASIKYATGQGSWTAIAVDAALLAAPGAGKFAAKLLDGTAVAAQAGRAGEALSGAASAAGERMARVITDTTQAAKVTTRAASAFAKSIITDAKDIRIGLAQTTDGVPVLVKDGKTAGHMLTDAKAAAHEAAAPARLDAISLSSDDSWANAQTLDDHFQRHGADFGATSAADYANQASDFLQRGLQTRLPTKIDTEGTIRIYDPSTDTFGSYRPGGETKTFFKPTSPDYWGRQPGAIQ